MTRVKEGKRRKRRIRPALLILLWVWAALVFVVVDLFRNVSEFDAVRPRARLYRAMRYAAHKMVAEPYHDGDFRESAEAPLQTTARRSHARRLRVELDAVSRLLRQEDRAGLVRTAKSSQDARVRIAALESLVAVEPAVAQGVLVEMVENTKESSKVRRQAARLLGRTGPGAIDLIEQVLASRAESCVKSGAIEGLAEVGSVRASRRLVQIASSEEGTSLHTALRAISVAHRLDALSVWAEVAIDRRCPPRVRVAALRALGNGRYRPAVESAMDILGRQGQTASAVRAAAAEALGKIGDRRALGVLAAASEDHSVEVVRHARIARSRLEHIAQE